MLYPPLSHQHKPFTLSRFSTFFISPKSSGKPCSLQLKSHCLHCVHKSANESADSGRKSNPNNNKPQELSDPQEEKRTNTQSSQIHGQSSKNPPSAGSDSDVLDNGIKKEMLGLHRSVVNWKIKHMRHGSKIKDPLMATEKKPKENRTVTTDLRKEKDTRIRDISERKIAQAADSVDKMTNMLPRCSGFGFERYKPSSLLESMLDV